MGYTNRVNGNARPLCLYDMKAPWRSAVKDAIEAHREGDRRPVSFPPEEQLRYNGRR